MDFMDSYILEYLRFTYQLRELLEINS